MTLSPRTRTLVSFISVKACLTGAEWLLRGARAQIEQEKKGPKPGDKGDDDLEVGLDDGEPGEVHGDFLRPCTQGGRSTRQRSASRGTRRQSFPITASDC